MYKLILIAALLTLTGCGLNPKQMGGDAAMCAKIYGTTTTFVGGKGKNVVIDGDTCSIATRGSQ